MSEVLLASCSDARPEEPEELAVTVCCRSPAIPTSTSGDNALNVHLPRTLAIFLKLFSHQPF